MKDEYIESRTEQEEQELLDKIKTLKAMNDPIQVKFKKLHPDAKLPTKGSEHAGAWDVYCTEVEQKGEDKFIVKLGFALEFSENYRVMIQPRSSITKTGLIMQNTPGLGDADYRGEYQMRFYSPVWEYDTPFPYKPGDRVGQLYFERIIHVDWEETTELTDSDRGEGGFGSTGK